MNNELIPGLTQEEYLTILRKELISESSEDKKVLCKDFIDDVTKGLNANEKSLPKSWFNGLLSLLFALLLFLMPMQQAIIPPIQVQAKRIVRH